MSPTSATRSRTHHLGFWRRLAAALVCALAVAGCASMRGGVEGDFARAAEQVASAAASSRLSLLTYEQGRNTAAATDTALGDMSRRSIKPPPRRPTGSSTAKTRSASERTCSMPPMR